MSDNSNKSIYFCSGLALVSYDHIAGYIAIGMALLIFTKSFIDFWKLRRYL